MKKQSIAVIGHPLGHTMSPFIHKELFNNSAIDYKYSILDIAKLEENIPQLQELSAFNITIPYKEAIIPYLDSLDEKAKLFGSVNTVKVENRKMRGYTTDGIGCLEALKNQGIYPKGKLLILGNGGAARAIAFEILFSEKKGDFTLVCRETSKEKTEKLAAELRAFSQRKNFPFSVRILTYAELETNSTCYNLLLNATSVGMYPNMDASPVSIEVVKRCKAVFDAVYNPVQTKLLSMAMSENILAIGGMDMLVNQAAAAHEIWFGKRFEPAEIAEVCRKSEEEMERKFRNIVLCGFMGSGKTSIGKKLAREMGRQFIDLDHHIENKMNMRVSAIFEKYGEEEFRRMEREAVAELSVKQNLIIACGGGTVMKEENVKQFHAGNSIIVFLDVSLETLQERLKNDRKRPLLQKGDRAEIISNLYKERAHIYRMASDIRVFAGLPVSVVIKQIVKITKNI
jgi:shikimate 5-dehydrogenase